MVIDLWSFIFGVIINKVILRWSWLYCNVGLISVVEYVEFNLIIVMCKVVYRWFFKWFYDLILVIKLGGSCFLFFYGYLYDDCIIVGL